MLWPQPNLVLDESIDDVDMRAKELFLKKNPKLLWGAIFLIILVEAGLVSLAFHTPTTDRGFFDTVSLIIFTPIVILGGLYGYFQQKVHHQFMRQFAMANNFQYQQKGWPQNWNGALASAGHDRSAQDLITGNYQNHPLCLFNYRYVTGSGKSSQTHNETIIQITHDSVLPPLLLTAGLKYINTISPAFPNPEKLDLEGDFNNYFTLYTQKEYEIEALEIFTPEFMEKTKTDYREFSIEFNGNQMSLYYSSYIENKSELQKMFGLAQYLIDKLEPRLERMKDDVAAMNEQFQTT